MIGGVGQSQVTQHKKPATVSSKTLQSQTPVVSSTGTGKSSGISGGHNNISSVRNYKPGKSNPQNAQGMTQIQSDLSKKVMGRKSGINWSNTGNALNNEDMTYMKNTIGNIHSGISPDKAPKNLSIEFVKNATIPTYDKKTGKPGKPLNVEGVYNVPSNTMKISTYDITGQRKLTRDEIMDTFSHEYGHAVADTNKSDKNGKNINRQMIDGKGRDITSRANALEEKARKNGHKPGDLEVRPDGVYDSEQTIYDKHDPYVKSYAYQDASGNIQEKYARLDSDENYAETFKEYTRSPGRFRKEIVEMEGKLKTLTPGTDEYKYLNESIDIRKSSYNYFKNNVFQGKEF